VVRLQGYGKQWFLSLYREPRFNRRFPFSSCAHCVVSCDAAIEFLEKLRRSHRSRHNLHALHVFDHDARVVAVAQKEHRQIYPQQAGSSTTCWKSCAGPKKLLPRPLPMAVYALPISLPLELLIKCETTIVWERKPGKPIANAIVWQDTRVSDDVRRFSTTGGQDRFRPQTGLPLSTYFSGLKLRWLLQNISGAREKTASGDLLFGNVDTFLLSNLNGGAKGGVHVTDVTNASRTQLLSLKTLD